MGGTHTYRERKQPGCIRRKRAELASPFALDALGGAAESNSAMQCRPNMNDAVKCRISTREQHRGDHGLCVLNKTNMRVLRAWCSYSVRVNECRARGPECAFGGMGTPDGTP